MIGCVIAALAVSLALPKDVAVCTDAFAGMGGAMPSVVAGAELVRGETALVVRVRCRLPEDGAARARGHASRPESMFSNGGDTVEVMLAPFAEDPGAYFHFIANPSNELYLARGRDASWRPPAPVASRPFFERNLWGVEFEIPYAALGLGRPEDGDAWRANFSAKDCSWTGATSFHDTAQYGVLTFGGEPPAAYVESAERGEDGTLRVTFAVPPREKPGEIPHKCEDEAYDLALTEGGERLAGFRAVTAVNEPDYLTLDRFYYPAGERLDVSYAATRLRRTATVRVRRLDGEGKALEFRERANAGSVELGPLAAGEYALEVDDGRRWAACQFEVLATNACESPAVPHYPVAGSEQVASAYLEFKRAMPSRYKRSEVPSFVYNGHLPLHGAGQTLDAAVGGKTVYRLAYEAQLRALLEGEDGGLAVVQDNPAFFAECYRDLKRAYPRLTFSIHLDSPVGAEAYARACDVLEYADPRSSYARDIPAHLRETADEVLRIGGGRPVYLWLGVSVPGGGRWRTAEELNLAVRYSVLRGLAGNVLHLGHGGLPLSATRLWSFVRGCERAVNAWYPIWAVGRPVDCGLVAEEGVVAECRKGENGTVLVAVNFSRRERRLSFEDPVTGRQTTVRLPGYGSLAKTWE